MLVKGFFGTGNMKLATLVAALLFALGIVFAAGSAGAAPCPNCDPGGGDGGDTTAPTITSVSPPNGSLVHPAANVTVTFSEGMEPASITPSTFTLVRQGQTTPVAATVSYDAGSNTATLDPNADLAQPASYTATVKGGAGSVTDLVGNALAADHTWSFNVPDNTPPTVTLTSPAGGAYVRGTITLSANANDNSGAVNRVEFRVRSALVATDFSAPYSASFNTAAGFSDGPAVIQAMAFDASGNGSSSVKSVTIDNTDPVVSITSGPSGTVNSSSATFEFSASDANMDTVACNLDNSTWQTCASPKTYTGLTDGGHALEVRATDKAGNGRVLVRNWTVDTTVPTGSVQINGGAAYTRSAAVKLSLSSDDLRGVASMRFSNDGAEWSEWEPYATSKSWTLTGGNGARTVHVQYRDTAGNVSAAARDTIKLDTTRPTVSGMSPRHKSVITDTTPTIKATVKDKMTNLQKGNIKLYVAGKRIANSKFKYSASTDVLTYNSPNLSKGKKTVRIVATDAAGNVGARSWYFTIKR